MNRLVDARGLSCPLPVMLTAKALEEAERVTVIVDNQAAAENVNRLAGSRGCGLEKSEKADGIYLEIYRTGKAEVERQETTPECANGQSVRGAQVTLVLADTLGTGPQELGRKLMAAFFHALTELSRKPDRLIFMNDGVRLAVEGSQVIEDLRTLAGQGVEILVCGTCLNYFGLAQKLAAGRISNIYEIAERLLEANSVVRL